MVVIDLGARIIKVNQSLLRKDIDPHSHILQRLHTMNCKVQVK